MSNAMGRAVSSVYGAESGAGSGGGRAAARADGFDGEFGAHPPAGASEKDTGAVVLDAQYVTWRLEEAGRALLALPHTGHSTRLRTSSLDIVRTAMEAYGWGEKRVRPPVPSAAQITRMDEAYAWLQMIPQEKFVLRRIVGARSLVNPMTDRHLFPWRRLGDALGADHKAVQRWWAQGVAIIVAGLN